MKRSPLDRLALTFVRGHAARTYARFERDIKNAAATQNRLLMSLIREHAESQFGRDHGLGDIRSYAAFARRVPILTYADVAPYINQVRSGHTDALFRPGTRVRMFAMTSGTVDKPKYIPITDRFLADLRAGWNTFGIKALTDHDDAFLRHIVQVTSPMDEDTAPSGAPCGAITGLMASTQKKLVRKYYVAPLAVAYINDTDARRYAIMRLAMPVDVSWIVTASPATVLQLAQTGASHAESIIRDIHNGTLSGDFDIPGAVRDQLAPRLVADPDAASRLSRLLELNGRLLPRDYWNLSFLANWTGGTMGLYLSRYMEYFGETPVRDIGLLATEGRVSIPVDDGTPSGVAAVSQTFLEFIPAEQYGRPDPTVLRCHEVEQGAEYFVLLTNAAGLFRYDICDCVRVTGWRHGAPLIEFLHKGAHIASMTGEKLTERQVVLALECVAQRWGSSAHFDFATAVLAPQWSDPPYYRLYATCEGPETLATDLDAKLQRLNAEYSSKRISGRLGPVECRPVLAHALREFDTRRAGRFRRANEQFKHQYLLTKPGDDDELARRSAAPTPSVCHQSHTGT
jgi:hypothetical protein